MEIYATIVNMSHNDFIEFEFHSEKISTSIDPLAKAKNLLKLLSLS